MAKVLVDVSMSVDGFIAGPNVGLEQPMGEDRERLHTWLFAGDDRIPRWSRSSSTTSGPSS
jgi:hypothetical protein